MHYVRKRKSLMVSGKSLYSICFTGNSHGRKAASGHKHLQVQQVRSSSGYVEVLRLWRWTHGIEEGSC